VLPLRGEVDRQNCRPLVEANRWKVCVFGIYCLLPLSLRQTIPLKLPPSTW